MAAQTSTARKEVWFCEQCRQVGSVQPNKEQTDLMSVVYLLQDDHAKASPQCENSAYGLRVVNPKGNWRPSIPEWALEKVEAILRT